MPARDPESSYYRCCGGNVQTGAVFLSRLEQLMYVAGMVALAVAALFYGLPTQHLLAGLAFLLFKVSIIHLFLRGVKSENHCALIPHTAVKILQCIGYAVCLCLCIYAMSVVGANRDLLQKEHLRIKRVEQLRLKREALENYYLPEKSSGSADFAEPERHYSAFPSRMDGGESLGQPRSPTAAPSLASDYFDREQDFDANISEGPSSSTSSSSSSEEKDAALLGADGIDERFSESSLKASEAEYGADEAEVYDDAVYSYEDSQEVPLARVPVEVALDGEEEAVVLDGDYEEERPYTVDIAAQVAEDIGQPEAVRVEDIPIPSSMRAFFRRPADSNGQAPSQLKRYVERELNRAELYNRHWLVSGMLNMAKQRGIEVLVGLFLFHLAMFTMLCIHAHMLVRTATMIRRGKRFAKEGLVANAEPIAVIGTKEIPHIGFVPPFPK